MRRSSSRVKAILEMVDRRLPLWDLCCATGQIGCVALERLPDLRVVFVEKRPHLVEALRQEVAREPHYAGRHDVICADVLAVGLPATAVNFVMAGVGTNLIAAFLARTR